VQPSCWCTYVEAENCWPTNGSREAKPHGSPRLLGAWRRGLRDPPSSQRVVSTEPLGEVVDQAAGGSCNSGEGAGTGISMGSVVPPGRDVGPDSDAVTATWLAKATMMLFWTVSIAYICLAAAAPDSSALQAADRLLPFLTGLVGLVFGFYFSPWRRRL
jgi:hypothetical protein